MSRQKFLEYLQTILTMADTKEQKAYAHMSLIALRDLSRQSNKIDAIVVRMMMMAEQRFEYLWDQRDEFVGRPGEYTENQKKRNRLAMYIAPGC